MQLIAPGHAKRNARLTNLGFRAHQPLAHGAGRHQEGRGDGGGVQAQGGLQDQRRTHRDVERRVGAGEHQAQAFVGDRAGRVGARIGFVEQPGQLLRNALADALVPVGVDHAPPRHRQQPGLRVVRQAVHRPVDQRARKGVGQGVFGQRHVAGAGGEKSNQPAVALPRRQLGGVVGRATLRAGRHRDDLSRGNHIAQTGRTSIVPCAAPGQRAAQLMAASRSAASIR